MKYVMKLQSDPKSWYSSLRQRVAGPLFQFDDEKSFDDVYNELLMAFPHERKERIRDWIVQAMAQQDNHFDRLLKKYKTIKQKDIDYLSNLLQTRSMRVHPTVINAAPLLEEDITEVDDNPVEVETVSTPNIIVIPKPVKTIWIDPSIKHKTKILSEYTPILDSDFEYLKENPANLDPNKPQMMDFTSEVMRDAINGPKRNLIYLLLSEDCKTGDVGSALYNMVVTIGLEHGYKKGKMPEDLFKHLVNPIMLNQIVMGSGLQEVINETERTITQTVTEED